MAWTLKVVTILEKCTISTDLVTNSAIGFKIMFAHDNEKYVRFRTKLIEFAWFPECNCLMSSFLFTSFYNVMSSLTSILCLENRTTRSETSPKPQCICCRRLHLVHCKPSENKSSRKIHDNKSARTFLSIR